jgi:hypothetical protein
MIRRQKSMRFLGGFYAFPGGKVDPEDGGLRRFAAAGSRRPRRAAGAVEDGLPARPSAAGASCRETGVPRQQRRRRPYRQATAAARIGPPPGHRQGAPLAALLAAEGWYLDLGPFRYLSHFITPPSSPIRFTARFFLAPVPAGQSPRLFHEEASESFWVDPAEGFRRHRSGEWAMAEPADSGLGLCQFDSFVPTWRAMNGRHKQMARPRQAAGGHPQARARRLTPAASRYRQSLGPCSLTTVAHRRSSAPTWWFPHSRVRLSADANASRRLRRSVPIFNPDRGAPDGALRACPRQVNPCVVVAKCAPARAGGFGRAGYAGFGRTLAVTGAFSGETVTATVGFAGRMTAFSAEIRKVMFSVWRGGACSLTLKVTTTRCDCFGRRLATLRGLIRMFVRKRGAPGR